MSEFKDHFSNHAKLYVQYRPTYPGELFEYLAKISPERSLAWDCATGNGQAALSLSEFFDKVVATDASASQIEQAIKNEKIEYHVLPAEKTNLVDQSLDLVTVAQALHWFDFDAFFQEVKRVLKPNGVLAVWCYELMFDQDEPKVNMLIERFYKDIVGSYWPEERKHVESGYQSIAFPFQEAQTPFFYMVTNWNLKQVLGYLGSWSASQKFEKANGISPLKEVEEDFLNVWGNPDKIHQIEWPLKLRVGKMT